MPEPTKISKLRERLNGTRGLRQVLAKVDLADALLHGKSASEALTLASEAVAHVRGLLARARHNGAQDKAYRKTLGRSLHTLGCCFNLLRRLEEAGAAFREAGEIFEELAEWRLLILSREQLAEVYYQERKFSEALEILELAFDVSGNLGLRDLQGRLLTTKGDTYNFMGEKAAARATFEQAVGISEQWGSVEDRSRTLHCFAVFLHHQGEHDAAGTHYGKSLALARTLSDRFGLMSTLFARGILSRDMGDGEEALLYLREAAAVAGETGYHWHEAEVLFSIARIHEWWVNLEEAFANYNRALEQFTIAADQNGTIGCLAHMGRISFDTMDETEGRELLTRCRDLIARVGARLKHLSAIMVILKYIPELCDLTLLEGILREMLITGTPHAANQRILRYSTLGQVLEMQKKFAESETCYSEALTIAESIGEHTARVQALLRIGKVRSLAGNMDGALDSLLQAEELSRSRNNTIQQMGAHAALAEVYEYKGDLAAAIRHYKTGNELEAKRRGTQSEAKLSNTKHFHEARKYKRELAALRQRYEETSSMLASEQRVLQLKSAELERCHALMHTLRRELRAGLDADPAGLREAVQAGVNTLEASFNDVGAATTESELAQLDHGFLHLLARLHPRLTDTERKVCAFVRLNLSNKNIARLLNVSPRAIETYRYRIRKKMGLSSETDLNAYILELQ